MNLARVVESRNSWRRTAVERRATIEAKNRQVERLKAKLSMARSSFEAERARSAQLELQLAGLASKPAPAPAPAFRSDEVRVLCVMVFLVGVIPCNAVTRVLSFLSGTGKLALRWIPDPSSIVNWIGRAGLGSLAGVARCAAPWIAIIDTSISFGRTKALVVLRIPVDHFMQHARAPGPRDVECIGLSIAEVWNGETVEHALEEVFARSGQPSAILKDGGTDLAKAVEGIVDAQQRRGDPKSAIIADVGHVAANALKALYNRNQVLGRLLALIEKGRDRMRQSDIASIRPPRLRTKGRYQAISRIVDWASNMAWLMGGSGRAAPNSLASALRKALPGLSLMKPFLVRFERDCLSLNAFLELLKNRGLNKETERLARKQLERIPRRSRLRKELTKWLEEHASLHESMALANTPLLVSSDVIETIMGMLKQVIERMPTPEFSTLTLATPLFCGPVTPDSIQAALARCPHGDLLDWRNENCAHTHRKRQSELLIHQVIPTVQETRSRQAA
jgi:hypothetical protein